MFKKQSISGLFCNFWRYYIHSFMFPSQLALWDIWGYLWIFVVKFDVKFDVKIIKQKTEAKSPGLFFL